jgi:plastocyanin
MRALHGALALAVISGLGSFSMAQVTGTVKLEGTAPEMSEIDMAAVSECAALHPDPVMEETVVVGEGGELANVVITISAEAHPDVTGEVPEDPAVLDQEGCTYHPHVLSVTVGQKLVVKNSDPFLHNVHAYPEENKKFNEQQPNVDEGKEVDVPKVPETYPVKCDVHPWMQAYIVVQPHPFHAVSKDDGTFEIDTTNLPDGEYTFTAWHEKLKGQEQVATVTDGKAELTFTFNADEEATSKADPQKLPAATAREIMLTSGKKADPAGLGLECCGDDGKAATMTKVAETKVKAEQPQAKAE